MTVSNLIAMLLKFSDPKCLKQLSTRLQTMSLKAIVIIIVIRIIIIIIIDLIIIKFV